MTQGGHRRSAEGKGVARYSRAWGYCVDIRDGGVVCVSIGFVQEMIHEPTEWRNCMWEGKRVGREHIQVLLTNMVQKHWDGMQTGTGEADTKNTQVHYDVHVQFGHQEVLRCGEF